MTAKRTVVKHRPVHEQVNRRTGLTFPRTVEGELERLEVDLSHAEWELSVIQRQHDDADRQVTELETAIRVYSTVRESQP